VITPLLLAATLAAAPAPRLGADVTVVQPTRGPVVCVLGSVRIEAEVDGDVVALGGDVTLADAAAVHGDVVALGGSVTGAGTATGRVVSLASLDAVPSLGQAGAPSASSVWGVRLLRIGGWMVVATLLLVAWPRQVRRGGEHLRTLPVRTLAVGALSLAVWLVVVLLALAAAASRLGLALLLAGIAAFLAAKVFGLLAVAWLVGVWLRTALPMALRGEIPRTGIGMSLLAVAGLLPVVGPMVWLLANVAGVGSIVASLVAPRLLTLALVARGSAAV
jgi:hypothetical protein